MNNETWGRIPVTLVEIDQDLCCNVFATSDGCGTCNALPGDPPCFNTRATCRSPEDYTLGDPLTLRFAPRDRITAPTYLPFYPSLNSISTSPTRLNVGGRASRDKPLGRRAEIKITFTDHPDSDRLTDPYVDSRSYDPLTRGGFWSKWLRRNPFHQNRAIRIYEGYDGQDVGDMQVRHYVIEKIEGPDASGRVSLTAQDVLRLADDDKAQAPGLSTGLTVATVAETDTTVEVTGASATDYSDVPGAAIRIGDEVMTYASITTLGSGNLQFNSVVRGAYGTTAEEHDDEETVQACLVYNAQSPWSVARDLLETYGNVPPAFIPYADWEAEANVWLSGFTVSRVISEPTGVNELLGELCEQSLFYIWWDELDQEIKFRAVRPEIGAVPLVSEDNALIAGQTNFKVRPELRASEVWVSFLPRDVTETEDRNDYRRTRARVDTDASGPNQYSERRVYEVQSQWLESDAQVDLLTFRLLARYRRPPTYLTFQVDVKDRWLKVGEPFDFQFRGLVDEFGAPTIQRYQVISAHEIEGSVIKIEAQQFDFEAGQRFGRWMVADAPVYTAATDEEKETGFWWSDAEGRMSNGDDGYVWS